MLNILVVDDNANNRELLIKALSKQAKCTTARNGEEALAIYRKSVEEKSAFDVILLDIAMPGIDGLDVLKVIREEEKARGVALGTGIPVIIVTAFKEAFLSAFDRGCDDYILKPIDIQELRKKIEEKVSRKQGS